jgi:carbon storage regulator
MLVLTRKSSQKILIGDDITVTVTRIDGGSVRLGIEAPRDLFIRRAELVTQWQADAHQVAPTAAKPM